MFSQSHYRFSELKTLFIHDDGSLPDFYFEKLTAEQVCVLYNWLRSRGGIFGEPLVWDTEQKRDVLVTNELPAAERVVSGRYQNFRHGLNRLEMNGVIIPQLTVEVTPDLICIDYRAGAEWGDQEIVAMMELLRTLQQFAPDAELFHMFEGEERTSWFPDVWKRIV